MDTTERAALLRDAPLFSDLDAEAITRLAERFEPARYTLGRSLCRAGEPADAFFLIGSGRARVLSREGDGAETTAGILTRGAAWGDPELLAGGRARYSVRATGDVVALRLARADLAAFLHTRPDLPERFARHLAEASPAPPEPARAEEAAPPPAFAEAPPGAEETTATFRHARRFPLLLQVSETDCGAVCLAMILRYWGRHVSVGRLRTLANVSRDGATLWSLARAAETLGLEARGIRAAPEGLAEIDLPAIAHWEGFHYVVLYAVRPDHVLVADPAIGLRRLTREQFAKGWTGFLLLLTPTRRLETVAESKTTLGRWLPLLAPYRRVFADILLGSFLLQILGLASPVFTQIIVDRVLVHESAGLLPALLFGMLLVAACQTVVVALRYYLVTHTARRIQLQMAVAFYRHLLSLPLRFFADRRVGEMLKRFHENARISSLLSGYALNTILDCGLLVVYVALMLSYNVRLTLVALAFLPGYALLATLLTPILRRQHREGFEKQAEAEAQVVESVTGIGTVKAAAAEPGLRWKWQDLMIRALNIQFRNAQTNMAGVALASTLNTLSATVLVWYGARLVLAGELSVGQLIAFNVLAVTLTRPVLNLMDLWNNLQEAVISLERLNDVFDALPEEDPADPSLRHLPAPVTGHVRFENVSFRYPTRERNVLQNVTLDIRPGQTVALVGRSGAGKTTLAGLLLRLHEPTGGRITIDGIDIRRVTLSSLRSQIGVVLQDTFLFSGTIRDNIALGDPDAPLDRIVGAAMLAGAHDFIQDLPLAYETRIGEHGQSLSGGQQQRVAIARALFKEPRILVLDEATSSLDTESELMIQENFETVLQDRTTLVIAHRLSTVRRADLIVVLDNGLVVESGTHAELLAQRGLYYHLHSQQIEG